MGRLTRSNADRQAFVAGSASSVVRLTPNRWRATDYTRFVEALATADES